MFKFSAKPLSPWGVFISGCKLYKNTLSKTWYVFLLYWVTTLYVLFGYAQGILPLVSFTTPSQLKMSSGSSTTLLIFSLCGISFFLLNSYFKWVALHRIYRLGKQPASSASESFNLARKKYWILLGNYILISTLMVAVLIPFVVPAIFLSMLLLFCAPEILFSGKSVTESIKESCGLVWGKWWQTFFTILLPLALFALLEYNLPYYFVDSRIKSKLFGVLLSLLSSLVIMPVIWATVLAKYNDLKLRKLRQA